MPDHSRTTGTLTRVQREAGRALECGDVERALAVYEQAILRDAENLPLVAEYGFLLWRMYAFDRGRVLFAKLLDDRRTDLPTLKAIAKQFFMIGQFGDAAATMRVAVQRDGAFGSRGGGTLCGGLGTR